MALLLAAGATTAQEHLRDARSAVAATTPGTRPRLQACLVEAHALLEHDLPATIAAAARCADLSRELGDVPAEIRSLALLARAQAKNVGKDAAMANLRRADALLGEREDHGLRATVGHAWAMLHWSYDDLPDCLARLRRAIYDAEEAGDARLSLLCELQAVNVVGFSEEPLAVLDRLRQVATDVADPFAELELRMLRGDALVRREEPEQAEQLLRDLLEDSARLGSRAVEAITANMLARLLAESDPPQALAMIRRGVTVARDYGDREILGLELQGLAYLSARTADLDTAKTAIDEAVATFEAMGMEARLYGALETAMSVASARLDETGQKAASARRLELDRRAAQRSGHKESDRFWSETERLRLDMRATHRRHEDELAAVNDRVSNLLITAGGAALLLVTVCGALLWRSRRHLQRVHSRLIEETQTAARARQEREALERNLGQLERLDSIGLLAGGFAHDFNNILVGVKGNAQLLLLDPALPAGRREPLEQIVASSDRAARLCKDILTYARADGEVRAVIDVRDVLRGVLPIARSGFGAGIDIAAEFGDGPALVAADGTQLEQVFLNLLTNASEAIGDRGTIRVGVVDRRLPGAPPTGHWFGEFTGQERDCVAVTVTDSGQGMSQETIRRIFDPFFSTRFPGRGIGLAAAFGILRRHQGVVEVVSEPGRGSRFTVYLPRAASAPTLHPQPAAPPTTTLEDLPTQGPVLVVDDEPTVLEVVRRVLQNHGLQVHTARSGAEALHALATLPEPPLLAILDFTMTDTDGTALAAAMRQQLPELPIVLMSGHDEAMVRSSAAACEFLAKPFDAAELLRTIRRACPTARRA